MQPGRSRSRLPDSIVRLLCAARTHMTCSRSAEDTRRRSPSISLWFFFAHEVSRKSMNVRRSRSLQIRVSRLAELAEKPQVCHDGACFEAVITLDISLLCDRRPPSRPRSRRRWISAQLLYNGDRLAINYLVHAQGCMWSRELRHS